MQNTTTLEQILLARHFVTVDTITETAEKQAYYNAMLLANYGIILSKPEFVNREVLNTVDTLFHLNIPKSFYDNPQDTKYFACEELLIEQLVSYFFYGSDEGRIELFKKACPEYVIGDELKLRTIYIVNSSEAGEKLREIATNFCAYTRPWGIEEASEFVCLFEAGYYKEDNIACKDNILFLIENNPKLIYLARMLDKKDIVKLSIKKFGDKASFITNSSYAAKLMRQELDEVAKYIPYVKHCPMSKKQAKYFNKICKLCDIKQQFRESNIESPDKFAISLLNDGDIVGAAKVYAASGSMLERRIKMLLSRANPVEAVQILEMLPAKNPIALYQMVSNLMADTGEARTFTFYYNNKVKTHRETEYEKTWRKSKLNEATRKFLKETCIEKIKCYYRNLPLLGTLYIDENFYKLGLPTNTSAGGKGIDVLPTGSRLPVKADNIRTFVHWKDAFDIDSSLIVVDNDGNLSTAGWFNYHDKSFGDKILFSGDITGSNGAEYFDIKLKELRKAGYRYVVQTFHGYCSKLNCGEIYAGYQVKSNLETKAWDPKNIEFQFRVQGDSRGCVAFAIDLETMEIIILNQIMDNDERVVDPNGFKTIEKFLSSEYLDINLGEVIECRAESFALQPEDAYVVFSDTYTPKVDSEQTVIRSWELEKLVALINS